MSELIKVTDLSFEKMKLKDLKEYSLAQYATIESLKKENDSLQEKIAHLESLLINSKQRAMPLSDEEIICIEQINVIKTKSSLRELSLDEVKRLDLLIKNLRLIRQQSTQVIESVDYNSLKEDDLVRAITTSTSG